MFSASFAMLLLRSRAHQASHSRLVNPDSDYINFLRGVTPNTVDENMMQLRRFNMGIAGEADCPVFDGMYEYCQVRWGGMRCAGRVDELRWNPRLTRACNEHPVDVLGWLSGRRGATGQRQRGDSLQLVG